MKTWTSTVGKINKSNGYTFLVVLIVVVVMGISAEATSRLTSTIIKREKEQELLFRGQAYAKAIKSYYLAGKTIKTFPKSLDDLLKDPRYIDKKHIRKLYIDPLTNKPDWVLIRDKLGGISGIASSSEELAMKTANFPAGLESFEKTTNYTQWRFVYSPEIRVFSQKSPVKRQK